MEADSRFISALSDRYAIESRIDTGGMATVYRARDLRHERTVAIKVLRPDLVEAVGADRFLREIRTTANLSHPHILPLFDSGEASGLLYYVMPFVEGESLRDRLNREEQLPLEDAVQIAREVADALAYAHEKGVIHRDIKPANIMLERGHALLADFGIAQARAGAEKTRLTGAGMSLGTPDYMSPEQISGKEEVEGRSDQYALGCVLYEMLAGYPPFTGSDIQTVMRQHLAAEAPKVTGARPSVPAEVAKALHRALAKIPADRYRTMTEFEKALAGATLPLLARIPMGRARGAVLGTGFVAALLLVTWRLAPWASGGGSGEVGGWQPDSNVIAVAPFLNRTGDTAYDQLGSWLAADIENRLLGAEIGAALSYRRVAPVLEAAGPRMDPVPLLSRELGAGTVVTGFIDLRGDSLEITAECVDARSGTTLYPIDPVRGSTGEEASLIAEIRDRVAGALALHLDPGNPYRGAASPPRNPEAYEEYRRAIDLSGNSENWGEVAERALRAWTLDTTFIDAALLAYVQTGQATVLGQGDWREEQDSMLAYLLRSEGRMTRAQRYDFNAKKLLREGRTEEALRELRAASEFYPLEVAYDVGHFALWLNRAQEALEAFRRWEKGNGEFLDGFVNRWPYYFHQYGEAYHRLGRHQEELEIILEGKSRAPDPDHSDLMYAEVYARIGLGQVDEVRRMIPSVRREGGAAEVRLAIQEMLAHGMGELAREVIEEELGRFEADASYFPRANLLPELLLYADRAEEAHALFEEIAAANPDNPWVWAWVGITAPLVGDTAQALEIEDNFGRWGREGLGTHQCPFVQAQIRANLGDPEGAVRFLEEAYYQKGKNFDADLHRNFTLQQLQGHPAYDEFMRPKG